ncbi:MAG TPA: GNAT family N-acetyltransferase [Candidatus Atribacteria bacterium]|nr:GNAT family N-acetyltransferase [Candidatus Atribacteria bacterium]HPT78489.1 GNAT family N-acetyltransferase [Candidatus Atribacteria bacterium]
MGIVYNDKMKDLPAEQLYHLFYSAGWADERIPDADILRVFNHPFINSTLVVSAWDGDRLVGAVRVLSDKIIRSVIYDLVVAPEYHSRGIGSELIRRCVEHFPDSEWVVQTERHISGFYEKLGFTGYNDIVLTIPSKYQRAK